VWASYLNDADMVVQSNYVFLYGQPIAGSGWTSHKSFPDQRKILLEMLLTERQKCVGSVLFPHLKNVEADYWPVNVKSTAY
jgi:hypothetical protein